MLSTHFTGGVYVIPYLTVDHVSALSDVGVALAAGFAAWQGIKNLSAWRNERVGGRRMDLAEEALVQFYQIENAFNVIRSPMGDMSEHEDREVEAGESPEQKHNRNIAHSIWKRMQAQSDLFSNFFTTGLKLRAVFGQDIYDVCVEVRKCFGEVRAAAQTLYITPYGGFNDQAFDLSLKEKIWNMEKGEGSIEYRVSQSIKKAEEILSPHLK